MTRLPAPDSAIAKKAMYSLSEIGRKFGRTRERIRQIEKEALEKIAASV